MRLIVTVNGQKFRVPCGVEGRDSIEWLASDVARRYERYNKLPVESVQIEELRTADGAILDAQDDITEVVSDMEEITGVLGRLAVGSPPPQLSSGIKSPLKSTAKSAESPLKQLREPEARETSKAEASNGSPADAGAGGKGGGLSAQTEVHPRNRVPVGSEVLDSWAKDELKMRSVDGHKDGTTCLYFNSGRHLAVSGGRDKLVKVWDTAAESCLSELEGHEGNVRAVDTANNVIVSGGEATVRVWDLQEGVQVGSLPGHEHYVSAVALDDEMRLVTASWDRSLRIWRLPDDGRVEAEDVASLCKGELKGHTASVLCMHRNGDRLVSGSLSGEMMVWNLLTMSKTLEMREVHGSGVNALAWERSLIFAAADTDLQVWDTSSGRLVETMKGHTNVITCLNLCFPYVLTGSRDNTIKVWSVRSWSCVRTISAPAVRCMSLSHRTLAVGMDSGNLQWWSLP